MLIPKVHNSEISKLANFDFGFGWLLLDRFLGPCQFMGLILNFEECN